MKRNIVTEQLADLLHREWHLTNSDANNNDHLINSSHPQALSRKTSDHNNQQQSLPIITTTDYSDSLASAVLHVSQALFKPRRSSETGYDTEGGIDTDADSLEQHRRHHRSATNVYEISPRIPPRRPILLESSKQLSNGLSQRRASHENHLTVHQSASFVQNHDEREENASRKDAMHRRHIRSSRRVPQLSVTHNHGAHEEHSTAVPRHHELLDGASKRKPLRLVFVRHSERVNQVLGTYWFLKAFESGNYAAYDPLLPKALPQRHSHHAYEFDVPLTLHGLKLARHTGTSMLQANIVPDVCLSSSALRCIQTSERLLTGLNASARIPIRVEPGLFECPHQHQKVIDSFMTKSELIENGYNIKLEYKPLISKIDTPESLADYFDRCSTVMRGIVNRYGHRGGTVLIVTHAPGLLALTSAIKGKRPDQETFYRAVGKYPPLAMYIAEYDGKQWKHSEEPFSFSPLVS
ncbi:unnamed protein product [Adineta ricciae]|uniref:Uncharacterized protein n=1 Tax=Adineta ricciae TaxID=249248 RepID=A0A815I5Y5_ADIRI|nr:unnamed protein product [Adineta ricciae]CAF1361159.1 unnamed protein product [Adineta ricciae]